MSTPPVVELVAVWVETIAGGGLRMMVRGLVRGRLHDAQVLTTFPGSPGRVSAGEVLLACRQLRKSIARRK